MGDRDLAWAGAILLSASLDPAPPIVHPLAVLDLYETHGQSAGYQVVVPSWSRGGKPTRDVEATWPLERLFGSGLTCPCSPGAA